MDEIRIKLTTRLLKNVAAKLIAKAIRKKYGCKVNIQINDLDIWAISGDTNIKANVEVRLNSDEFVKILKGVDLD